MGVGGLGAVLVDVVKHAEVVLGHEQDGATNLYLQQMERIVLEVHLIHKNAISRHVVSFHSLFWSQHMQWVILTINLVHCIWKSHFYMDIACGVDRYPRNMPCRNSYSCPKLANRKGCNKKFTQVLPVWCWQKLSNWDRRQLVKNYCKRSCKNCLGKWMCHI